MSWSGWVVTISPGDFAPSAKVSSMAVAPSTTCRLVRMSPSWVTTTPLPRPPSGSVWPFFGGNVDSMRTSEGWTAG